MSLLQNIDKKPFQAYTIEHGIERIFVKVPLKESKSFETEFAEALSAGKDSKENIMAIVNKHNGSLHKKGA